MRARAVAWCPPGAALLCLAPACLPADTRPPPTTLTLTVVSDAPASLPTVDGWSVTIERLIADVGNAALDDGCISYSESRYDRLLDTLRPGEQKLNLLFGSGYCNMRYRSGAPSFNTLLGDGVSAQEKILMGAPAVDPYNAAPAAATIDFAASARRGQELVRVHWLLRQVVRYHNCGQLVDADAGTTSSLALESDGAVAYHLAFDGAMLLRDAARGGALRFDPVAAADRIFGDADGEVTLEELDRVPLQVARQSGAYALRSSSDAGVDEPADAATTVTSLGKYIVWAQLPYIAVFREPIRCTVLGIDSLQEP